MPSPASATPLGCASHYKLCPSCRYRTVERSEKYCLLPVELALAQNWLHIIAAIVIFNDEQQKTIPQKQDNSGGRGFIQQRQLFEKEQQQLFEKEQQQLFEKGRW